MPLSPWIFAQLAVGAVAGGGDSIYASAALREMVVAAAASIREPPAEFRSYTARVETELSLIIRDTLGRERAAQIEQLAATARWQRMGPYNLHVVGYRSQSVGVPYSALSIVRGWTIPSLYGDRLRLGASFGRSRSSEARNQVVAVHPFAGDRDAYYNFAGGDTVTVLRTGDRSIPIARVRVTPRSANGRQIGLFHGEVDLDASRHQIVRMRGQFVMFGERPRGRSLAARLPGIVAVAYAEFVSAEYQGRYWLPAFQRTEFQASIALLGQTRSIFRLVSRFGDFEIDTGAAVAAPAGQPRIVVTYAAQDSISRFHDWRQELGVATANVTADDFDDVGPDVWRTGGPPRLDLVPIRTSEMLRFNRIEGFYTGLSATLQFRDRAPGLSVGAFGGWAWTERTLRGGARASLKRGSWTFATRAERSLDRTNDFTLPLDDGGGIGALAGSIDDNDYVDRTGANLSATRLFGGVDAGLASVQLGLKQDRAERSRLRRGVLGGSSAFRPNRGAANGRYVLGAADLEINPNVTGDFVQPGLGARLHYEGATGDLEWQRIELGLSVRRYWGLLSIAAHADGGLVVAEAPPPQTLIELGGVETLPGYDYKEFAGDRAALFRAFASFRFPIWRKPVRVFRGLYMPGLGPGIGVSAQGGWAELSSDGARRAVDALGAAWSNEPVSRATDGVRATVGAGLTFFSDMAHVGFARPVDHASPWRFVLGFGQRF